MSYANAHQTSTQMMVDNYTPLANVRFDGVEWDQGSRTEWLEFFVLDGAGEVVSVGSSGQTPPNLRERNIGVVMAHIYVKEDRADGETGLVRRLKELQDAFAAVFKSKYQNGLTYKRPTVSSGGASPVAGFRRTVVTIPFEWDETT